MADLANAAVLASLVVGMVSIPAASGTIKAQSSVQDPVTNISTTEDLPVKESTSLEADSFQKTVETAFSSFTTTVESGEVNGEMETPGAHLTVEKGSGTVRWVLETPQGRLEVEQSSSKVVHTTETPQGTLTETRENGNLKTEFEGSDREEVEETASELRELMEERKEQYLQKTSDMRTEQYSESLKLSVEPETPEKVKVTNTAGRLKMQNWRVTNDNPDSFSFNATLEKGQTLHIYSEKKDSEELDGVEENDEDVYIYDSGLTWADGGDAATLFDSEGNEVENFSY